MGDGSGRERGRRRGRARKRGAKRPGRGEAAGPGERVTGGEIFPKVFLLVGGTFYFAGATPSEVMMTRLMEPSGL